MKKIAATGLLMVFLFNIIGYRIFFYYLEREADLRFEAKLETFSHLDKGLITVKIPINLPYQLNWKSFERVDGEVYVKGKVYRYVKQKVYRDTLILLCINDKEKTAIQKYGAEYFQKVNDLATETNKKPVIKNPKLDFFEAIELLFNPLYASVVSYSTYHERLHPLVASHKRKIPPRPVGLPV
ncbi:MAG TPA: hypothetical protein VGE26_01705 [Sphingobacteriaceae bacterium]